MSNDDYPRNNCTSWINNTIHYKQLNNMNIEFQNRWSKPGFNLIEINLMKIGNDKMGYRYTLFFYLLNVGFIYKTKVKK